MTEKHVRAALCIFCHTLTAGLGVFVWIMMDASSNPMASTLMSSLLLMGGVTAASQVIYALKGKIFEFDGALAKRELLFSIIFFQIIMQFGFGFSLYAVNQTEMQNQSYDDTYRFFIELQHAAPGNSVADYEKIDLTAGMPECVGAVTVVTEDDFSDAALYFRFPIGGGKLLMLKNQAYFNKHLRDFAVNLFMSMVISILLMIELVYMAAKVLDHRIRMDPTAGRPTAYLRQFAFLFYFAGFLSSSFIPLMARDLYGDSPNANFIAGLPYSVEAATNCLAILMVTPFFRKKGWKPPYMAGIGIFMLGVFLSAMAGNIELFILARAIVGVGYGMCWITLRSITTLDGDQAENFSSLTSGIYAGIMSGAAFGAVLADKVGYKNVLLISMIVSLAAAILPMSFKNEKGELAAVQGERLRLTVKDVAVFAVFLLTVVVPACVTEAFCDYVSPLYINGLGLQTAYIGRVSLMYNLCIVYIGSALMMRLVKKLFRSGLVRNIAHMALITLALLASAYLGGFLAILAASMVLGTADGFGFSVQNAYVLETRVAKRLGKTQMMTYLSLFKKFAAMLGPLVFGLFLRNGIGGLGLMGVVYGFCALTCALVITALTKSLRHV